MQHPWQVRRRMQPVADGARRWDRAYLLVLSWSRADDRPALPEPGTSSQQAQEVSHDGSGGLRSGVDAAAGAGSEHRAAARTAACPSSQPGCGADGTFHPAAWRGSRARWPSASCRRPTGRGTRRSRPRSAKASDASSLICRRGGRPRTRSRSPATTARASRPCRRSGTRADNRNSRSPATRQSGWFTAQAQVGRAQALASTRGAIDRQPQPRGPSPTPEHRTNGRP